MDEIMSKVNLVFTKLQDLQLQPTEHNLKILILANQYLREVYMALEVMKAEAELAKKQAEEATEAPEEEAEADG